MFIFDNSKKTATKSNYIWCSKVYKNQKINLPSLIKWCNDTFHNSVVIMNEIGTSKLKKPGNWQFLKTDILASESD